MSDERKAIVAAAEEAKRLLDQLVRENTSLRSEVARLNQGPLSYGLLEHLNTRPRTTYLARLLNPNPEVLEG